MKKQIWLLKKEIFTKSNLQDTLIINEYSDLKPLIHGSQVYEPQTACNKWLVHIAEALLFLGWTWH